MAQRIIALNGQPIVHNEVLISLGMRVGGTKIAGKNVRYKDLYADLYQAIEAARENSECYITT